MARKKKKRKEILLGMLYALFSSPTDVAVSSIVVEGYTVGQAGGELAQWCVPLGISASLYSPLPC